MQVCIPEPFTNNNNNINLEESKNIKIVGLSITDRSSENLLNICNQLIHEIPSLIHEPHSIHEI